MSKYNKYIRISGVYKIESLSHPDRIYIGSSRDIERRWVYHRMHLKSQSHANKKLQRHYDKYGNDDLKFGFVYLCTDEELLNAEQYFLDVYSPYFNICKKAYNTMGREPWNKGMKGQSKGNEGSFKKGNVPWIKGKKGLTPNKNKGKHGVYSDETLQKMARANKNAWRIRKQKQDELVPCLDFSIDTK